MALAGLVAITARTASSWMLPTVDVPALVLALVIGLAIGQIGREPVVAPGLAICAKTLLKVAVVLLGLRVALQDIAQLGLATLVGLVVMMAMTVAAAVVAARLLSQSSLFGTVAGVATAVCGASAALATASVLPSYKGKEADVLFVILTVNILSTIAMVVYPLLGASLGFGDTQMGVMLGASIHDVAQVIGSAYAVSEQTGNTAVVVKLARVSLLLPVLVIVGYVFGRGNVSGKAPFPWFVLGFLVLCVANTLLSSSASLLPYYLPAHGFLRLAGDWLMLTAIAAIAIRSPVSELLRVPLKSSAIVVLATGVCLGAATLLASLLASLA
nr:putative sulfate exporter family transporter [Pseudaminobacter soli]